MLRRLLIWAVRSSLGGPSKSWVFTSVALLVLRVVKSVTGRRELVDVSKIKKGDTLYIEQLPISHKRQMKEMKQAKRQARKARRRAAKAS